jgi:hypothetical protein
MNIIDRAISFFLVIGIWGVLVSFWINSNIADAKTSCKTDISLENKHNHSTNDISKFKWKVRRIVEDCSVSDEEIFC